MNFNLISPEGNGFNYNVRFNEPIVVPENASVSMNWAQFERDQTIRFAETQTITVNPKKVLPHWDYHNNGDKRINVGGNDIYRLNGVARNSTDLVFYIEAGTYTLGELQTKINQKLGTKTAGKGICSGRVILRDNFDEPIPTNPSLSMYDMDLVIPPKSNDNTFLEVGFTKQNTHTTHAYHPTNKKAANIGGGNGLYFNTHGAGDGTFTALTGATNVDSWKSYAMGSLDYIHTGTHFNQYTSAVDGVPNAYKLKDGGFDELENLNTIVFTPNKVLGELKGDLYLGLYSEAYAGVMEDGVASHLGTQTDTQRTNGATLIPFQTTGEADSAFVPMSYFGVRIMGETSCAAATSIGPLGKVAIQIYSPHIGTATNNWDTNITEMKQDAATFSLENLFNGAPPNTNFSVGIQSYYDRGAKFSYKHGSHKGKLHFRVFVMFNNGAKNVIYDTNTKFPHTSVVADGSDNYGYDPAFMESMNAKYVEAVNNAGNLNLSQARASGFPFTPMVASTHQGEGGVLDYVSYTLPSSVGDLNNMTNTHLLDYSLTFSTALAQLVVDTSSPFELAEKSASYVDFGGALDFLTTTYGNINNIPTYQNEFFYRFNSLNSPAALDKYSIVLNGLPIKSYKNTNDKSKSGYRKPILASIPKPYNVAPQADFTGNIVGSYQASLGIVNRLSNQALTTNNFDILILDMETDKPAEQITKSIVNFTITAE